MYPVGLSILISELIELCSERILMRSADICVKREDVPPYCGTFTFKSLLSTFHNRQRARPIADCRQSFRVSSSCCEMSVTPSWYVEKSVWRRRKCLMSSWISKTAGSIVLRLRLKKNLRERGAKTFTPTLAIESFCDVRDETEDFHRLFSWERL